MGIILIMGLGMIVGKWVFPEKIKKWNEKAQLACTLLIIFSMGIMLGEKENFLKDLPRLGIRSFIFLPFLRFCQLLWCTSLRSISWIILAADNPGKRNR